MLYILIYAHELQEMEKADLLEMVSAFLKTHQEPAQFYFGGDQALELNAAWESLWDKSREATSSTFPGSNEAECFQRLAIELGYMWLIHVFCAKPDSHLLQLYGQDKFNLELHLLQTHTRNWFVSSSSYLRIAWHMLAWCVNTSYHWLHERWRMRGHKAEWY